ncbi:hypothetical protein O3M35_004068 [Rhynocoris fuscipes]|uniref:Ufm1-specific protease 2 n=1 Tax=Rhynocoris fuscipes TaxID=488301 RepID=A0AAW1CIH5_9HEMI
MIPSIIIMQPALQRLNELNDEQTGELFGIIYDGNLLIIGMNFDINLSIQEEEWHKIRRSIYPSGIDWCGLFHVNHTEAAFNNESLVEKLKEVVVSNNPVYIDKNESDNEIKVFVLHNDNLISTQYQIMEEEEFATEFVYFNLRSVYDLNICEMSESCIVQNLDILRKRIGDGQCIFHVKDTEVFLSAETSSVVPNDASLKDYCKQDLCTVQNALAPGPFFVDVLFCSTTSELTRDKSNFTIRHYTEPGQRYSYSLPIDFLCVTRKNRLIMDCFGSFIDAMCRWCDLVRHYLVSHYTVWVNFAFFKICHFYPKKMAHYMSYIYTSSATDDGLAEKRKYLHELFHLTPPTCPLFRWGNAVIFGQKSILLNVHNGLKHEPVKGGRITLVKGMYDYYHYMQSNFNDNGWGCAYRSLQTIFSWFKTWVSEFKD